MGFGLLMIGYFTATMMSFNLLGGVFRLIGYFLICFAAKKLYQYNTSFIFLFVWSIIMSVLSAGSALSDISAFLHNNLIIAQPFIPISLSDFLTNTKVIFDLIFTALLCFCIRNIAKETGATKIIHKAVRNFIYFCIFCVFQFVVWLASVANSTALTEFVKMTALPVWMVLLNIICVILISLMIFSCYANICDVNDLDMRVKPSKFEFINRRREAKERKSQAYIDEAEKYAQEQKKANKNKE